MFKRFAECLRRGYLYLSYTSHSSAVAVEGEKQQQMDPEGDQNITNSHTQRPLPHTHVRPIQWVDCIDTAGLTDMVQKKRNNPWRRELNAAEHFSHTVAHKPVSMH